MIVCRYNQRVYASEMASSFTIVFDAKRSPFMEEIKVEIG